MMPPSALPASGARPVVLITGTSSGIGKACAAFLVEKGYRVYGASRQGQPASDHFVPLRMDVQDDASVQQGIECILQQEGRIDVVLNNAGFGIAGAIEDSSIEEVKRQFETNFFGTFRVCKAVLPSMRARRSGLIINVSSIMGLIALPYQSLYAASKFAIEGMTEGLRLEVKDFGIRVVLVEPGDFRTNFVHNRRRTCASERDSAYRERFDRTLSLIEEGEINSRSPEIVARTVYRITRHRSPKVRYRIGSVTEQLASALKKVLPSKVFEWILTINYRL